VLLGAIALVAATRRAPPFREISDGAILEIYTLEAIRGTQLLGPYSRFGWHHPGPFYFYLLAPWYWLSGLRTAGMQAGALAINLTAMWLIVRTTIACASVPTAIAVSGFSAWYAFRAGDMAVSAWNPHVIVLPLMAFIVLSAAMAADPRRAYLLALVAVGAFLAQTHLAMIPIVAVLGAGIAWTGRGLSRATWAYAAGLKLLLWTPPLVEQITHRPGNLVAIVRFFVSAGRGQASSSALSAWASSLTAAFRPEFRLPLGAEYIAEPGWFLPVAATSVVGVLVALAFMGRRRTPFETALLLMCAAAAIVAFLATTRIQGDIVDHEIFWMSGIGVLAISAVVGFVATLSGVASRAIRVASMASVLAWLLVALVGADGMRHVLDRRRTLDDHAVDVVFEQIEAYRAVSGVRKPRFEIEPPIWPIAAGALLQIDKMGMPFAVGERWAPMFGERFAATGREDGTAVIGGSAVSPSITPVR
jgi:hypothetical protein